MGTVLISLPTDGTTADVGDYNTPITTLVTAFNGNIDNTNISSTAAIATSKLADDGGITGAKLASYKVPYQTDNGNTIANTTGTTVKMEIGWGQILGTGVSTLSETVTFPVAFTTVLGVTISWLGFKSGGASAADITQFTSTISAGNLVQAISITTTGFTMSANSSSTFGAAYHGYSWIAWGL